MPQPSEGKSSSSGETKNLKKEIATLTSEVEQLRKELEQSRKEQIKTEEQAHTFKLFAESSGQGFGMARLDGTIIYMNPALCRILDEKNAEDAYKKSFPVYYPPAYQKRLKNEILPKVLKEGQWIGELVLISARGRMTSTLENFFLLRDRNGNPMYFADVITDISEQKAMTTALAEYSPNMTFINVKGKVVYANKLCEEVLGYTQDELYDPAFNFLQLTAPDYQDLVKEKFRQHMAGKEVEPYEYALITKEGKKIYAVLSTKLIPFEGETAILGVVTDISKRKEMETSVRVSELNLRAILEASTESVFLLHTDGTVLAANKTTAERLGLNSEPIVGKNIYDILPRYQQDSRKEKLEEAIREKRVVQFQDQREGLWLDSYVYPVMDNGDVTRLAVLAIDITERKNAEQSLLENEALLRSTLESIGTGILVVNEHGKATHSNKIFAEMWRIPDDVMASGDDDQLIVFVLDQLKDPDQFLRKVKELYQTDRIDYDILEFKDGRFFERISNPLLYGDKIAGRVWGFRDITQRKNMEIEIHRINEELRELNASKDKFFSIIAHDLRSPFSGLLGLSEVLADPTEELTIEQMRKYSGRLHVLLRNQFNLLQNLLEWSRLQRGAINYRPERLNLRTVLNNVSDQVSVNCIRKNINLTFNIDSDHFIHADADMLHSVCLNLISNAIKFTKQDGRIVIQSKAHDEFIEVSVQDSGVGISSDRLKTIFSLDEVSSTSGTAGEKGTGLGLLLCKEFIDKHGGKLSAESEPGKGSRFIFTLPVV